MVNLPDNIVQCPDGEDLTYWGRRCGRSGSRVHMIEPLSRGCMALVLERNPLVLHAKVPGNRACGEAWPVSAVAAVGGASLAHVVSGSP